MAGESREYIRPVAAIADSFFDVLIIGGGIVGAGVARDAALRGLKTLLLERSDFASGTSSRSSRLLHGGLRYLAQGRLGLVREASVEKMRVSRVAPHLCQPLPFVFPAWRGMGPPRWQLSLGVFLYDLLCGRRNLGRSETLGVTETLARIPGLRVDGLTGATRHFDAFTHDARLVIDTLRSAETAGAIVRNYAPFLSGTMTPNGWRCSVRDELTGETLDVRARTVINAAGAWASRFPQSALRLRLTKGVHLVIDRTRLPVKEAVVLTEGKRILFVIPWGERVILGTTDTDYSGDPAEVRTDPSDVGYVINVINRAFPEARLAPDNVIATWAGLRPLIASRGRNTGAPSDLSRRHVIHMTEPGWFDVAGGKLTIYRRIGEQAVDLVGNFLGRRLPKSRTADEPLPQSPFSGVLPPPVDPAVVEECCQSEWAVHLDDVLLRRTSWHFYHTDRTRVAEMAAGWMAKQCGWDRDRQSAELDRYRQMVDSMELQLGWRV